ncbi:hypothetical protein [Tsukamurella hominis]|uniref:hypothetical protein n=1 Tax=Tsukamurella hominis TaxID=1970232 RepID=UPI0039ED916A
MTTAIATKWTLYRDSYSATGSSHGKSIPGEPYTDRADALAAAVAIAEQIAGPDREGYRRPVISIVDRAPYGVCIHIDDQDHVTIIAPVEHYVPVTISA